MRKPPAQKPYAYVNATYGVPAAPGVKVTASWQGCLPRSGVIVAKRSYDHYVHVRWDGTSHDVPVHPNDLTYLGVTHVEKA